MLVREEQKKKLQAKDGCLPDFWKKNSVFPHDVVSKYEFYGTDAK